MLLEIVADGQVAELGRVVIPADRMTAGPVAVGCRADGKRHGDAVASVEAAAAHLGELPPGTEIARAPLRIRLEAAARQHHRSRADVAHLSAVLDSHAADGVAIVEQRHGARAIANGNARGGGDLRFLVDESRSAAPSLHRQSAPEFEATANLEGLPAINGLETDAQSLHPPHGVEGAIDEAVSEFAIGAVTRNAKHVVKELLGGVSAEIRTFDLLGSQLRHDLLQIVDAAVGEPDRARCETAVAAALGFRRALQHQNACALLAGGERRAEGRVPSPDDDDVIHAVSPDVAAIAANAHVAHERAAKPLVWPRRTSKVIVYNCIHPSRRSTRAKIAV